MLQPPHTIAVAASDETGRGLALVEALADGWGVVGRHDGVGKMVWFELTGQTQA